MLAHWILLLAATAAEQAATETQVEVGVPLRVALEERVNLSASKVGTPVRGVLVEPVYLYDRAVLAAGTKIEGHIAEVGKVPGARRFAALLSGNFTPPRAVLAQFDSIVLDDGSRVPIQTAASTGTPYTARVSKKAKPTMANMSLAFRAPGKMNLLKDRLLQMLPYQRHSWRAGTMFQSVLQSPLSTAKLPVLTASTAQLDDEVEARLVTPLSSATAQKGSKIEAIVTRPYFGSANKSVLIPEGTKLTGEVVEAKRARFLHRNGKLLFVFRQIQPADGGTPQQTQGYLEGVDADFGMNLNLDSEGAARIRSPKSRFVFPAIAALAAGMSLHQDYNAQGVPDQDIGGRAQSGAVGLGLIGTVVAQISRPVASGIAFTGAGFSIYSTFLARGADVVLPVNTRIKVGFTARSMNNAIRK